MSVDRDPAHLHPAFAYELGIVHATMRAAGAPVIFFEGLRRFERQAALYEKGRTTPGVPCRHSGVIRPVRGCEDHPLGLTVTNAKPGESRHSEDESGFGWAGDHVFEGPDPWGQHHPWSLLGAVAKRRGLIWGGDWRSRDLGAGAARSGNQTTKALATSKGGKHEPRLGTGTGHPPGHSTTS